MKHLTKMDREIKFRAWRDGEMIYQSENGYHELARLFNRIHSNHSVMQFTGRKDKNDKEIYEGDVFRVEEDGAEDGTDMIYHLVIVWIKEWTMFACLRIHDEYKQYLYLGIKALDEPMFWTYTLEDTNDRRFYHCGNIHENPEILTLNGLAPTPINGFYHHNQ